MAEFWTAYAWPTIVIVFYILLIVVPLLVAVAYLTYAERKVIAAMQLRMGPNVVGPFGLLQPLADGGEADVQGNGDSDRCQPCRLPNRPNHHLYTGAHRLGCDPI